MTRFFGNEWEIYSKDTGELISTIKGDRTPKERIVVVYDYYENDSENVVTI